MFKVHEVQFSNENEVQVNNLIKITGYLIR